MTTPENPIDCDEALLLLFELRDGTLDDYASAALQAHLTACASCGAAQSWDDRLRGLLHDGAIPEPSPGFVPAVRRRVRRQRIRGALVGVAAVLLVGGGILLWQSWAPPGESRAIVDAKKASPPALRNELAESLVLFEPPPVDSLDVLSRQTDGYVAALQLLGKE